MCAMWVFVLLEVHGNAQGCGYMSQRASHEVVGQEGRRLYQLRPLIIRPNLHNLLIQCLPCMPPHQAQPHPLPQQPQILLAHQHLRPHLRQLQLRQAQRFHLHLMPIPNLYELFGVEIQHPRILVPLLTIVDKEGGVSQ